MESRICFGYPTGCVVAVTGGAGGIGGAIVAELKRSQIRALSLDLAHPGDHLEVPDEGEALLLRHDVRDVDRWKEILSFFKSRGNPIRGLVNCAAILSLGPVEALDRGDLRDVLAVNLEAPIFMSIETAKSIMADGAAGRIVNISSIHAVLSEPAAAPYTAAKGALEAISRTMASEWAARGVTVNCVRPGAIRTPMSEPTYTEEVLAGLFGRIPMQRLGDPADVSAIVAFLLSNQASYITGAVVTVDGGFSMHGGLPGVAYSYGDQPGQTGAR